jgi:hypothetical protein
MGLENVPRCQHVKMNGTQCGSPALRRRRHCFFHDRIRREQAKIRADSPSHGHFELPLLEDANCVQVALMKTIQLLASGRMEHKTAGLILYALQTASINLRYTDLEVEDVSDVVIDRDDVSATCINGPQWYEEDFDDEEGDEEVDDEVEAKAEQEEEKNGQVVAAGKIKTAVAEKVAEKKPSTSEVRKQIQTMARNWILDTMAEKPQ